MNKIIFSTGNLYRLPHSQEGELIDFTRNLNVEGVELGLFTNDDVLNFKVSKESEKWLKKLDFVSIHGPMRFSGILDYQGKEKISEKEATLIYNKIEKIYKEFNCQQIVIHPIDLPDNDFLSSYNMKISTENLPKKFGVVENYNFEPFLEKMDELSLCLDTTHAFNVDNDELKRIIDNFSDRIGSVHFSGSTGKKSHTKIKDSCDDFFKSIEPVFDLKVPVIIEECFLEGFTLEEVQEEVDYVKKMWGK